MYFRETIIDMTLSFLNELKRVLANYFPENRLWHGKLTDEQLSVILGKSKSHIKKKRDQINQNPNYIISIETLEENENQIAKSICKVPREILELLYKFKNSNNPPKSIYGI